MIDASKINPNALTKPQLEDLIIKVLVELESVGASYNKLKYDLDYLKHGEIIKTIMDMNFPLPSGDGKKELSVRDREAVARTSEQFKIHMKAIKQSSIEFAPIKHKYDSLVRLYETLNNIFLKRTS